MHRSLLLTLFLVASLSAQQEPAAEKLARDVMIALVGTAVAGLDQDPAAAQRARVVAVLKDHLVPGSVAAERFDTVMTRPAPDA